MWRYRAFSGNPSVKACGFATSLYTREALGARNPCLSLWERWPSAAKPERGNSDHTIGSQGLICKTLSVTCGDSSPKGRAKGAVTETQRDLSSEANCGIAAAAPLAPSDEGAVSRKAD